MAKKEDKGNWKGKCLKCKKPMFKSKKACKSCLNKERLKKLANSRGRPKSSWYEYK